MNVTEGHRLVELTLRGISPPLAELIRRACTDAESKINLDTLDKGLSGARVLLAQWPLRANILSASHVLKIGALAKLQTEAARTERYISPVDPQVGHIRLYEDKNNELGLIRQAFLGSADGKVTSLKEWIRDEILVESVVEKIEFLYSSRMRQWHCTSDCEPPRELRKLRTAFSGRMNRQKDLGRAFDAVGRDALAKSFAERGFPTLDKVEQKIAELNNHIEEMPIGLIHGDLHAQNILVSSGGLQLIDFAWADYGWKAVDFLMLECSLKLLVVPLECRLDDLLFVETLLDDKDANVSSADLDALPYSRYLRIFAHAMQSVRKQAFIWRAATDFEQYRRGLIILMSCLGTYPGLNRNFLAHCLAYHVSKLR